jgi:hypothetical protein
MRKKKEIVKFTPDWGTLKFETITFGHDSLGTRTRERLRFRGPAVTIKHRPVLSSERAPYNNNPATLTYNLKEKEEKNWSGPQMRT